MTAWRDKHYEIRRFAISNDKKSAQLGLSFGTASGRLRKNILFYLVQKTGVDFCFRCNKKIKTSKELSIEHKVAWLDSDNPVEMFFDLDNITFSHLSCNSSVRRDSNALKKHPSIGAYYRGCKCGQCAKLYRERPRKPRKYSMPR